MSRSRKDDSRYPGLQSSPSREPNSSSNNAGTTAFHSPGVVSGHNYMRSKGKDRDRSGGYLAKDRVKTTNSGDATERYFAQAKQVNFQSPPPSSFQCTENSAASARELSWADEVELSMSNNSSQRMDANANTGGATLKTPKSLEQGQMAKSLDHGQMVKSLDHGQMVKSLDHGRMVKSLEQDMVEPKSALQSGNANQRLVDEKASKMQQRNSVAQPTGAFNNGKAKTNLDKEHESASFKRANLPQLRRGSRKKTLSLNPEEREALESLIEEVLMDGVIDSESASSDEETEQSEAWKNANTELGGSGGNAGAGGEGMNKARGDKGKMGRKYYPGQLKVALKHMTELPPRFSRKLKKAEKYLELNTMRGVNSTTGRIEEEDEESLARDDKRMSLSPRLPERDKEKAKSKEHQVKEFKRSIRTLLTDLDQYVDEKSVLSNSSSATSIHPPGAIICEDLERESLSVRQPDLPHEVPSTVQNLLLAAKGYTSMGGNQASATQERFQEPYQENESASSGSNFTGYTNQYAIPDSSPGSQFTVNVTEFVPKGMIMTAYPPPQEVLSPAEQQHHLHHHHQYQTSMMPQQSPGGLNDPNSRHGMTSEQMAAVSTAMAEPSLHSGMMDFSGSLVSMPPTLGTQGCSSMGERMMSPMPPVFVSSGMPMSNLPSPGSLPFYQFQTQNPPPPPPPSSSYSFPVQVPPFSSAQYCYMPPALPLQSLPPPYYPRDQVQYADAGMQFKTMLPDWGYQKPKHYSSNVSTLPTYSGFPNQTTVPPSYPGSEPGMNHMNFRQRKKQLSSSSSPRNMVSTSTNLPGGKLTMQRTRGNEGPLALGRIGLRSGQENADSLPHPEASMTVPFYGDASLKRFPFTVRSRVSGEGQSGYPGRRENRNFVSDKYAIPRTLTSDGKKEVRHVTLKPKQPKPNRSLARPRNDPNVAQLHPLKAHHPSDLSEEGLESPDNFGDVESGADDWSTDNYDQEVSKKGKEESMDSRGSPKDIHDGREESVSEVVLSCAAEENRVLHPVEIIPDAIHVDADTSDNVLAISSPCDAENLGAVVLSQVQREVMFEANSEGMSQAHSEVLSQALSKVLSRAHSEALSQAYSLAPECGFEPAVSEPVVNVSETYSADEEKTCVTHTTEKSPLHPLEIDRSILNTENLKRTAVCLKIRALLEDLKVSTNAHPSVFMDQMVEPNSERDGPSIGDAAVSSVCESLRDLSVSAGAEGIRSSEAELSADIDVPCEAIDEDVCRSELKGMDVMLGSNFIERLMSLFKPSQSTDPSCKCSPKTVHLSQTVLNQIYLEYVTQDQNGSNDLQNVTSGSLEEVANGLSVVDVPTELLRVNLSPSSVDERTLDAATECSALQQQQLCDTSCNQVTSCDDCKTEEDVVLNGIP